MAAKMAKKQAHGTRVGAGNKKKMLVSPPFLPYYKGLGVFLMQTELMTWNDPEEQEEKV